METHVHPRTWKQKLLHEFTEYWINVVYMALFFSAGIFYKGMILSHHGIPFDEYFSGVVRALIIAKVVMIGAFLNISRRYEDRPLIIPTIYKTILFTLWVVVFDIIEIIIRALIKTPDLVAAFQGLSGHITLIWLGGLTVIAVSFLPFFAMKELSRTMGSDALRSLFFKGRKQTPSPGPLA